MPVLHYSPVLGGLENWTQHIAEGLCEEAEFFVITGKVKGQKKEEVKSNVKIFRASLFSLTNLSHSSFFYILTALPFIFFRSLALIKKEKINLLHCQGFLSSFLGFLLSRATGVPYICTVQRLETNSPLKSLIYRRAAWCIGASNAVKNYFEKIGVKNIAVIPNGINLSNFQNLDRQKSREQLGLKDEFVVMTVARLEKIKGVKYLIEAFAKISPDFPDFKLIIIGDGLERQKLEGLVRRLDLQDKVKFFGQIPNEEISRHLVAADCFCLPSLKEGFGIAILEAMAAGVPVVASRVGGILDIIKGGPASPSASDRPSRDGSQGGPASPAGGQNGLLAEPGNPEDIVKAIKRIYSDRSLARNLTQNAKATLARYAWPAICVQVMEIYRQILSNQV